MLHDADGRERSALGGFEYSLNEVVLHTDTAIIPRRCGPGVVERGPGRLRAAREALADDLPHEPAPALPGPIDYLVSVNPGDQIASETVISNRTMTHPMYTFRTLDAQVALQSIQGRRATFFAGAHLYHGFHEDGCRSSFEATALATSRRAGTIMDLVGEVAA